MTDYGRKRCAQVISFCLVYNFSFLLTNVKCGQRRQGETAPGACEARAAGTRK